MFGESLYDKLNVGHEELVSKWLDTVYEGEILKISLCAHDIKNVDLADHKGNTALHWIARRRDEDPKVVQLLFDLGAKVDPINNAGETPLHIAIMSSQSNVAELFLNNGADPNKSRTIYATLERKQKYLSQAVVERINAYRHLRT